jgi:UDP-N-acetylmuramate-alanine ligase
MTRLFDPADPRPIHFVGIAGAGNECLAELFTLRGIRVTGCDAHPENAPDLAARASPWRLDIRRVTSQQRVRSS